MNPPKDQMKQHLSDTRRLNPEEGQASMRVNDFTPAFMDPKYSPQAQARTYDPASIEAAYATFNQDEGDLQEDDDDYEIDLESEVDDEQDDEEEEYLFTPPPQWMGASEPPTPPSLRSPNNSFMKDEQIFPGGPYQSEIASWKKQFEVDGHTVNMSPIAGEHFIWRTLNRMEYREIMSLPNLDPLQREEVICEVCVLWPYGYNFKEMSSRKAGIPAQLAEQIMAESGFARVSPPIRL